MNANELGIKAAELLDTTLVSANTTVLTAKHAVTTFLSSFKSELAARKLARQAPEVTWCTDKPGCPVHGAGAHALDIPAPKCADHDETTSEGIACCKTVGDVFRQHVARLDECPGRIQYAARLGETEWARTAHTFFAHRA